MKGDDDCSYEIVIEFDAFGRDLIRGRRWHSSQELIELPCGGARLRMILSGLEEIERAVLSWGTHATVIRPQALADRIGAITAELSARYNAPLMLAAA
jgi:predicted DNA-binding transcriptional regulator YafY